MEDFKPKVFCVWMREIKMIPKFGWDKITSIIITGLTATLLVTMIGSLILVLRTSYYSKTFAGGGEDNTTETVLQASKNNKAGTLLCDSDCKSRNVTERSKPIMERKGLTAGRSIERVRKHLNAVRKRPTSEETKKAKKRHEHKPIRNFWKEEITDLIHFLREIEAEVADGDLETELSAPKITKDPFEDTEVEMRVLRRSLKSHIPAAIPQLDALGPAKKRNNSISIVLTKTRQSNLLKFFVHVTLVCIVVLIVWAVARELHFMCSEQLIKHTEAPEETKKLKIEVPLPGGLKKNELRSVTVA